MKTSLIIQNLKCGGCAETIKKKLFAIKGISEVKVNEEASSVEFDYETWNSFYTVKSTLKSIGYPSEGEVNSILTKAKSYVSCASGKLSKT